MEEGSEAILAPALAAEEEAAAAPSTSGTAMKKALMGQHTAEPLDQL